MAKNRTAFAIALFLMATIAVTLVALPTANAHDPPWNKDTWIYVAVSPDPVGVNQQVLITWWTDLLPQTAQGDYGDRWHDVTITVTDPEGGKETLTQAESDPVGGGFFLYTPTKVGTYTLQAHFPGHTYTGEPQPPWGLPGSYAAYIGDTLNPSDSEIIDLFVQEEPIAEWPETPLPTTYWSRPIFGENRFWNVIGGNWLNYPVAPGRANIMVNDYVQAPETAHVMWTRPYWLGGVVGGEFGSTPYYDGLSYERLWRTPIVIQGRLYYSVDTPPRYGHYCIDLRTGEELWFQNSTGPLQQYGSGGGGTRGSGDYTKYSFGQILNYDCPNQHGAFAYIWSTYGSTWQMYDAWTGNWICNIENVPGGSAGMDSNGNLLRYIYNNNGWLALWNSTKAIWNITLSYGGNNYWTWRPLVGHTFDGADGYEWNVTAPANLGSIFTVLDDRVIGNDGLGSFEYATNAYSLWCLKVNPGDQGELMWKKDYAQPPVKNVTVTPGPASLEEGLMTIALKETRQWIAYDIDTGNKVWGPSESQDPYDMYDMRRGSGCGAFYNGTLLSWGYAGIVYCYDATDGTELWEEPTESGGFESYFDSGRYPLSLGAIGDGKIYLYSTEHSPSKPLWRGSKLRCIDIDSGETL